MNLTACSLVQWQGDRSRCNWCDTPLTGRRRRWCSDECGDAFTNNHRWTQAREAARKRDDHRCVKCGTTAGYNGPQVEVNHIVQCFGQHGQLSCAHHLDNLETLCRDCHRVVTAEQRRARVAA